MLLIKKIKKFLFVFGLSLGCTSYFENSNQYCCNVAKADNQYIGQGNLNIFLYPVWLGGLSDCRNTTDPARKFSFDSSNNFYELDYVLYENDYFNFYVSGTYISYTNTLSENSINKFAESNIIQDTKNPGYFKIKKTGLYHFCFNCTLENTISSEYSTWLNNIDNWNITFEEGVIDFRDPIGSYKIYLHGAFDGADFSGSANEARRFIFKDNLNAYELEIALFKGDIFCPYLASPVTTYIRYYADSNVLLNIDEDCISYNNSGFFVCKKDGTYKISLDYKIEYYTNRDFVWTKNGGGKIARISASTNYYVPVGNEKPVLMGRINSVSVEHNNSPYLIKYDEISQTYRLKLFLKRNDFFCIYMPIRRNYIYYLQGNEYARNLFDGAFLSSCAVSGQNYFFVNADGYYLIELDAIVENLLYPTDAWKKHNKSIIRYIGEKPLTTYVTFQNPVEDYILKTFPSEGSSVYQYGTDGTLIRLEKSLSFLNAKDRFLPNVLKIDFDSKYSSSFSLTSGDGKTITCPLKDKACYSFESGSENERYSEICDFIYLLSERINSNNLNEIDDEILKSFIDAYESFDENAKNLIAASSINVSNRSIHNADEVIQSFIDFYNADNPYSQLIVVLIIEILFVSLLIFAAICFKCFGEDKKIFYASSSAIFHNINL